MLIDAFLPRHDFRSAHRIDVRAAPADVYRTARHGDYGGSPTIRLLLALRGIWLRSLTIDDAVRFGFVLLEERPDEEFVLGLIARPWTLTGGVVRVEAADFAADDEPGVAKIAWNFTVAPMGPDATRLSTETRILCTDRTSRRKFGRYWTLVKPGSGWIRRAMLRQVRRQSERN